MIDDPQSKHMIAYGLTKPLKFSSVYNGDGVYKFVMQEVNTTDDDNQELGIADYWKHFKRGTPAGEEPDVVEPTPTPPIETDGGRRNWL